MFYNTLDKNYKKLFSRLTAHNAAECAPTNFHDDTSNAVDVVNPTGKRFSQSTCYYRWSHNRYGQFVVIIGGNLFGHRFGQRVGVWMFSLKLNNVMNP